MHTHAHKSQPMKCETWSVKYKVYLCAVAFKYIYSTFNVQWHECVAPSSAKLINALNVECDYGFLIFIDSPSIVATITMTMLSSHYCYYSIRYWKNSTVEIETASLWTLQQQRSNNTHTDSKITHLCALRFSVQCSFVHSFHQMCM